MTGSTSPLPSEPHALDDIDVMRATFDAFERQAPRSGWQPDWASHRSYTPDVESNRRLARALVTVRNSDPRSIAGFFAAGAVIVGLIALSAAGVPGFPLIGVLLVVAGGVIGLIAGLIRDIRLREQSVTRSRPAGKPWSVRIGPTRIWIQTASHVLVLPYAALSGVRTNRDFTFLRLRDRGGFIALPSSLYPEGAAPWIAAAIRQKLGGPVAYRFDLP